MSKALGKSLAKSAAVLIASWIGFSIAPEVGCLVSLIGSFLLLLGSYRREWKLTRFSVLLPPVTGIFCFLVQMSFFRDSAIAWMLFLPVAIGGWLMGWIRGKTHDVYAKKGRVYAQRTVLYLSVWVACYCITQIFGLLRIKGLVVFGLLSGAFSTAMLAAVAIVLLQKARTVRVAAVVLLVLVLPLSLAMAVPQDDCSETSDDDCSAGSVDAGGGSGDNLGELAGGMLSAGVIFILGTGLNIFTSVSSALAESSNVGEDEPLEEEEEDGDPYDDEWRPREPSPEEIARQRKEEWTRLVGLIDQYVSDRNRADFLKGLVHRNVEDGADMARIRNVVWKVTGATHAQEHAAHRNRSDNFGAWEKSSEETRDWSMRANRVGMLIALAQAAVLAKAVAAGTAAVVVAAEAVAAVAQAGSLIMAQGMTYGVAEGYAKDGVSGAATSAAAQGVDIFTMGGGSAGVRAAQAELKDGESRLGRWGSEWGNSLADQFYPPRIIERCSNAKTWGELTDAVLDLVDLGRDVVDMGKRGGEMWDNLADDPGRLTAPDDTPLVSDGESPKTGPRAEYGDGFDTTDPSLTRRETEPPAASGTDGVGPQLSGPNGSDGRIIDSVPDPGPAREAGSDDVGSQTPGPAGSGDPPGPKGPADGDDLPGPKGPADGDDPPGPKGPADGDDPPDDCPDDDGADTSDPSDDGDGDGDRDDDDGDSWDDDETGRGQPEQTGRRPRTDEEWEEWSREWEAQRRMKEASAEQTGKEVRKTTSILAGPTAPDGGRPWQPPHPGIKPSQDQWGRVDPPPGVSNWVPDRDHPRVRDMISGRVPRAEYDPSTIPGFNDPPDHYYGADEYGRPTRASGWLVSGKGVPGTRASGPKYSGLERGHLIPGVNGGRGDVTVPETLHMNKSHSEIFENLCNEYIKKGYAVRLDVEASYDPDYTGRMPSEVVHHMEVVDRETGQVVHTGSAEAGPNTPFNLGTRKHKGKPIN